MTQRLTVSLPDDVAAWLATEPNASAAVADALRARMADREIASAKRRRDAKVYADWAAHWLDGEDELIAHSNAISLQGHEEW
jgi:hypothetical protein